MSTKGRILFWFLLIFGGTAISLWGDAHLFAAWRRGLFWHLSTALLGGLLLFLVMRAARHTGRILAQYGREGELPRLETNRLVRADVYACMRHPMHLALFFAPLAIALLLGSPTFIFIVAPLEALLMVLLVILIEEPEARRKFGEAYRSYEAEVPRFNLSPRCLHLLIAEVPRDDEPGLS